MVVAKNWPAAGRPTFARPPTTALPHTDTGTPDGQTRAFVIIITGQPSNMHAITHQADAHLPRAGANGRLSCNSGRFTHWTAGYRHDKHDDGALDPLGGS